MINSYLRELVQNNRRVIIPDFGAFLQKDKAATTLENSLTFSPFLRFNDGLLEDYLVEKEHLTKEVASAKVRQYVQEIKQTIANQRPYYVDDLGAFFEDERGSVQFLFAETEKEARRKFEELTAASAQPNVAEVEVESIAAPEVVLEERKKPARKKAVQVENEEDSEEEADDDAKMISVKGRKKVDVKEAKTRETKDNSAVSKTIVNVTVNTDKDKKEQNHVEEKSKQLEAANSSLQRWMEEVEKRKEQQAQEEKQASAVQQPTPEELEAQRRRQEEIEHALIQKRRRDEEEDAKRKAESEAALRVADSGQQAPPAVWEEEVVERKKGGSRGAILLLVMLAFVLAAAATLWFWDDIQAILGWEGDMLVPDTEEVIATTLEPEATFVPAVVSLQPGMCYVCVASFSQQQSREMITLCRILHSAGYTPEVVATSSDKFLVSVSKYRSVNEAKIALNLYAQKFAQKYGQPWIFP